MAVRLIKDIDEIRRKAKKGIGAVEIAQSLCCTDSALRNFAKRHRIKLVNRKHMCGQRIRERGFKWT